MCLHYPPGLRTLTRPPGASEKYTTPLVFVKHPQTWALAAMGKMQALESGEAVSSRQAPVCAPPLGTTTDYGTLVVVSSTLHRVSVARLPEHQTTAVSRLLHTLIAGS